MSEFFDFELDAAPAEPGKPGYGQLPEPADLGTTVPVDAGPVSPLPSEVTARFAAEADALRDGTPPAAPPDHRDLDVDDHLHLEQAPAELAPDQQQQINDYLEAQIAERAGARAMELIDEQIAELYEVLPPEDVEQLIAQLPPETQAAIAARHDQFVEAVEYSELMAQEAITEQANQVIAEGVEQLRGLVASWEQAQPGGVEVDLGQLQRLAEERWPAVAALVGNEVGPELAEGVYRQVWEELKGEARGETIKHSLIEAELAKVGAATDPASVLATGQLADQLWPEIARKFGGDEQEAARASIAAAAALQTNFREPQSPRAISTYYAAKARAIRAAGGQRDGDPPLRAAGGSLPSQVTARYAREAAQIRDRGGRP